ncbi:hypothetical protein BIV57_14060 [Mangrovactinospora gilvigrisea]|uniref:EamA domain-containing protein n=2 Tax=Mangrovactinospora gilvigrisea TaxID=1428644 RepID=A0A1J7BE19_9ACTN|nr:hypothetical protein BIV57_14060 [Mangrovactinospora gilvigrisea]
MYMIAGMLTLQVGSALAVHLFPAVGPAGTAWLRISFAAILLVAVTFRKLGRELRTATRRDLAAAALLGAVSAGMTLCYSQAVARIPMGTATAIEFTGPLLVAVLAAHRRRELVWLGAAVAGLLMLTQPWSGASDLGGLLWAAGAAGCWAVYILATQAVGERFSGVNGLALAMVSGAIVAAPFGAPAVVANPQLWVIASAAGIAVLMPLLPYAMDLEALRRLTRTVYGTFAGLEPAVAAIVGAVVLAQLPGLGQTLGILLIVAAGVGAARAGSRQELGVGETRVVASGGPAAATSVAEPDRVNA